MTNPFGGNLMKKLQEMQAGIARTQEELKAMRIEGSAAGGLVTAVVNGQRDLIDVRITPEALADGDTEMLEDLVVAAVTAANEKAAQEVQEKMAAATGGMLPPGMDLNSLLGQG
jgi:DNA-binding YbaB/EbfC family protein